jgi:poly-gamma-glutamate system protein
VSGTGIDVRLTDRPPPGARRAVFIAAVVSVMAWVGLLVVAPRGDVPWSSEMRDAASRAVQARTAIARIAADRGMLMPVAIDPNRTGYIGPAYSEIATTTGQLEAKRTATNPDIAGLIVHLLRRAGAESGDTIAVGASASFPALIIAAVAAVEAMDMHPVVIVSLGSSGWGATNPLLDALHIYQAALDAGALTTPPAAASLGGDGDVGASLPEDVRRRLIQRIRAAGVPLLLESGTGSSVQRRLHYGIEPGIDTAVPRPAAYINIGGNAASLGASPLILEARPGLNTALPGAPAGQRGVMGEMGARGVPVIHLLNMRGLASRHGLPWDPIPLPAPGTTRLRDDDGAHAPAVAGLAAAYATLIALLAFFARRARVHR